MKQVEQLDMELDMEQLELSCITGIMKMIKPFRKMGTL